LRVLRRPRQTHQTTDLAGQKPRSQASGQVTDLAGNPVGRRDTV
jgi:hypothetical protein